MILCSFEELPPNMQTDEVRKYYDILSKRRFSLALKRVFDVLISGIMILILSPLLLLIAVLIKIDSRGPVFFRQVRITQYGKEFRIFKFRTMVVNADKMGTLVTVDADKRITRVGKFLRKCKMDELGQLFDVFRGTMTFVGTRPEVVRYVEKYTPEMLATLLLPAGVTSMTSIYYSGESALLDVSNDPDATYINEILPDKMKWNLKGIEEFSFINDIKIMFMTFQTVLGKDFLQSKPEI